VTEKDGDYLRGLIGDKLGICGCGDNSIVIDFLIAALKAIRKRCEPGWDRAEFEDVFRGNGDTGDTLFFWMALYFLDRSGLIEHGTSIRYSWLTDEGRDFLERFGGMTGDDIQEAAAWNRRDG